MNSGKEHFQSALPALHQTFGQGLEQALPGVLASLDQILFDLGEASTDAELQALYRTLRIKLQDERDSVLTNFRQILKSCIEKRGGRKDPAADGAPFNLQTLSLIEFDEMETSLGINGLAQRLAELCAEELATLSSRLRRILGKAALTDNDNPFGPEMIAKAMSQSFSMVEGVRPKLLLFKTLAEPLRDPLKELYRQINETMTTQGFELAAETIIKVPRQPTRPASITASSSLPAATGQTDGPDDLLAVLQHLMRPAGTPQPVHTAPFAGNSPGTDFPALASTVVPPLATPELLATLSQLQHAIPRGELPAIDTPRNEPAAPPAALDIAELTAGLANVLHHIRQTPAYNNANQVDAITIDVVAMMFDFIFDDKEIPASVKGLIGRLQIPVLKSAMLDKKFFSRKDNPARKLLDRIAHAAIGWHNEIGTDDMLYRKLDALILHIVDSFEENSDVFSEATADLDEFLQQEEQRAEARSRAIKEEIRKRELKESAPEIARQQIEIWCRDSRCTTILQDALRQYWTPRLAEAYASDGEASRDWINACRTIEVLLWSMEPKTTEEERSQLLKALPPLLQTLSETLKQQQAEETFSAALFAHLVDAHTTALKGKSLMPAPQQPLADSTTTSTSATQHPLKTTDNCPLPADGEIDTSTMPAGNIQTSLPDIPAGDEFDHIAHTIAKGTWVEFSMDNGNNIRCRLLWTSPLRSSHLFSSRDGSSAIKISPNSLALRLRQGKASILQDQPLVDRVVDNVLSRLKREQAATA